MVRFLWRIAFFALVTSVFAGERLNELVTAAQDFSVAIEEQLAAVQSDISATQLVEKMVTYAKAKTAYFNALRAEMPEIRPLSQANGPQVGGLRRALRSPKHLSIPVIGGCVAK